MINPILEIENRLKKYPKLQIYKNENYISIKPLTDSGFEVWFSNDKGGFTVGFNRWHEHFDIIEIKDAIDCFVFGLSDKCRLKVASRGGKNYKWTMEAFEDKKWVSYSTTALFNFAFWKKTEIKYYSNSI